MDEWPTKAFEHPNGETELLPKCFGTLDKPECTHVATVVLESLQRPFGDEKYARVPYCACCLYLAVVQEMFGDPADIRPCPIW